ncbi:hypothetical protein [Brucella anthropi]|uniref:hypothetical protein n=1 Tax=Brucella anthropi TaxID=529 RepID=UPI00384B96E0
MMPSQQDATSKPGGVEPIEWVFPRHMAIVNEVFSFCHDEATKILSRVESSADFLDNLEIVIEMVSISNLPEPNKLELIQLIEEERSILTFSNTARNCVLAV